MEIKAIYTDVKNGNLPKEELAGFTAYMVLKNLAWICLFIVLIGTVLVIWIGK